jgi:hypothetical protein
MTFIICKAHSWQLAGTILNSSTVKHLHFNVLEGQEKILISFKKSFGHYVIESRFFRTELKIISLLGCFVSEFLKILVSEGRKGRGHPRVLLWSECVFPIYLNLGSLYSCLFCDPLCLFFWSCPAKVGMNSAHYVSSSFSDITSVGCILGPFLTSLLPHSSKYFLI